MGDFRILCGKKVEISMKNPETYQIKKFSSIKS